MGHNFGEIDELPAETGTDMLDTDGTLEDVTTNLVVVMEDGAEDKISAENAMPRLCCCWFAWMPLENPQKTGANTNHQGVRKNKTHAHCLTNARFGARNCTTSQSEYESYEARRKPVCRIGAHDL